MPYVGEKTTGIQQLHLRAEGPPPGNPAVTFRCLPMASLVHRFCRISQTHSVVYRCIW